MSASTESMTQTTRAAGLAGLHGRLTVLPVAPAERPAVVARLERLLAPEEVGTAAGIALGPHELEVTSREAATRRVEDHERTRDELASRLRRAREQQAVVANRRDEAAARARRMSAHFHDCDALLERAGELTNAAEEARRALDARRAEVEGARGRLVLVEEQREAAAQMIDDAARQLRDLETSELDETTLRRELEVTRAALVEAEVAHGAAKDLLRDIEQGIAARTAARHDVLRERAELVARVEAPLPDSWSLREALDAFDDETRVGQADPVARELAREWIEVDGELENIESALPEPPDPDELVAARRRLEQLDQTIAELEAAGDRGQLDPSARDEIEAAHEAVLAAEEDVDQSDGHEDDLARLHEAREAEHAVLRHHGFETYLEVILVSAQPGDDLRADLLDAARARRVAEDTLASLEAASEPPPIVTTLRARRDRIYAEAADLLCCEPGVNVAELLYAHPVVPPDRTRELAEVLARYDVPTAGVGVREAAVSWLVALDHEIATRDECRRGIERLDRELTALDEDNARARDEVERARAIVSSTHADVGAMLHRVRLFEDELSERAAQDERRNQRIAAAEQLRTQIAVVTEALERSEQEYTSSLAVAEAAVVTAEGTVERATAALAEAVRRLRRISEALPPALRPRASDDPLAELPRLRETLAAEVHRAEAALAAATDELDRIRRDIEETQARLDDHLAVPPTEAVEPEDVLHAVTTLVGVGDRPAVLDDPFADRHGDRQLLLDHLVDVAADRPVVLLTDDPDTLSWAISLPDDLGAVTRLPAETEPEHPRPDIDHLRPDPVT
ncbi:MAG TPA: hypothetical protein VFW63_08625 [Acidimicrobiales bacterium]|nr:hypothetical protein [Acidimicrobiales bacterium]